MPGTDESAAGPQVLPGTYQVKLAVAGHSYTQPLKVTLDPRSTATPLDLQKQHDLSMTILHDLERGSAASREAAAVRQALAQRRTAAQSAGNTALAEKIAAVDAEAARIGAAGGGRGGRGGRGDSASAGPTVASVSALLSTAMSVAGSADRTPPATAYEVATQASRDMALLLAGWKNIRDAKLPELNAELQRSAMLAVEIPPPAKRN
jgi:hypothetical protein